MSRPTVYRWFPTKEDLLRALAELEERQFGQGLQALIDAQRTPARRLEAALRYLVTYLDEARVPDPTGVDPAFMLRNLAEGLETQVDTFARVLGPALDEVPAVRAKDLSREQAAELFLRLAYSHYLLPHPDAERLLAAIRSFAGVARRRATAATG